ncbi:hypothetical protein D3C84_587150 [compost metagenome]
MGIGMLQATIVELVEHEQPAIQLRVLADSRHQLVALPADPSDDAQARPGTLGPQALERIQQVRMVLARFDGADHQVHRVAIGEHLQQRRVEAAAFAGQIQLRPQVEVFEPEPVHVRSASAALDLRADLVANGGGDADEAISRFGDPVEPTVEHLDQVVIAELRMGQRNQVVDHRDDADALRLQALGDREEIGVPGGIEQQQLVTGLDLQRHAPRGHPVVTADEPGESQRQGDPQAGQLAQHEKDTPRVVRTGHRPAAVQARMPLPEIHPRLLQEHAHARVPGQPASGQRCKAEHLVHAALEEHHRNALGVLVDALQLADDVAHHPLDAGVHMGVFEHVGAFDEQTSHGWPSARGTDEAFTERLMRVRASSQEQPTKSSRRRLMTWNTRP